MIDKPAPGTVVRGILPPWMGRIGTVLPDDLNSPPDKVNVQWWGEWGYFRVPLDLITS